MGTIRKIVELTDPEYFCNRSWTLSYNLAVQKWISFHSYIPNWYIGENNFYYSGLTSCCEEFNFIVGELVPTPSTTTTSTTFNFSTTSTSTTALDCSLVGEIQSTQCDLAGTGVITVPSPPPPCNRPPNLQQEVFLTGYDIVTPPSTVVTTGSSVDACSGLFYIQNTDEDLYISAGLYVEFLNLNIGSYVYAEWDIPGCSLIPTGWYSIIQGTNNNVYHVINGQVAEIVNCGPGTTTSTTSGAPVQTFKATVASSNFSGQIHNVLPNFYTLNPGNVYPVLSNQTKTGVITAGGTTITVTYSTNNPNSPIKVYKNLVLVASVVVSSGNNLSVAINVAWLSSDYIEIVLS